MNAQQVPDRGFCTAQRQLAARKQSHSQASTSRSDPGGLSVDPSEYYRRLMSAARVGASGQAQDVLSDMVSSGLDVTPHAYHGLIFSHMKAGDDKGALTALYAALDTSALQPLPESYAVVIFICAENSNFQAAETVYNLVQAGVDRHPSWIAYLKGLVGAGLKEVDKETQLSIIENVEEVLREGEHQGWYPDPDLYEDILSLFCEDDRKALIAEDMLFDVLEKREGAETRHYNCILRAQAIWMGVHNARKLLNEMIEGKTGGKHRVLPDINSYNALIEGCLIEKMQGFSYAGMDLEGVVAETLTVGIQMNKRSHTLLLMFYLLDSNTDRVLFELREMERLATKCRVTEHLSDNWMGALVDFLLDHKCVLEVARMLFLLKEEGRSLPLEVSLLDDYGRSFHTRWLPIYMAGQHFERRNFGLEKYYKSNEEEEEEEGGGQDAFLIDDTYLNRKNVAIDENTGEEMSVSTMNASQMKAELEAKGLSTKGLKGELSRRVQHSRGSQPIPVREMMRRRRAEVEAKLSRDDEKQTEREVLKSVRSIVSYTANWSHMGEAYNTIDNETYVVDAGREQREKDREHVADLEALELPQETESLLKARRAAHNQSDVEMEYQLDTLIFNTDTPEFQALNPNFCGREGYGVRMMWPRFGKAARLALYMLDLAEQLDGRASIVDFVEILEACMEENDPDTAFALLLKFHKSRETADPGADVLFYNKVLLLCMQADRTDLAAVVADMMVSVSVEPIGPLDHPATLPLLQDYGSGLARLIRDIRRAGRGEDVDEDANQEEADEDAEREAAETSTDETEDTAVGAEMSGGDSSGDEAVGDVWEQGLEDEDEAMRLESENEGEDEEEVIIQPPEDFEGYDYEFDDEGIDVILHSQEVGALIQAGLLEEERDEENEGAEPEELESGSDVGEQAGSDEGVQEDPEKGEEEASE